MPSVRPVTLTNTKTGEVHEFMTVMLAEEFLHKRNGYIRRMLSNGYPVMDEDGNKYNAKLGVLTKLPSVFPTDSGRRQLCWDCAKATNSGCNWSRNFTPVEGWDAEATTICTQCKINSIPSYYIRGCPEFVYG